MKIVRIKFSPEAKKVYDYLNKNSSTSKIEGTIFKSLNEKIELIRYNFQYGKIIPKKLIPKEYKDKYGVTNLFRVELPKFWRMLYTITEGENEIEIIAFILDVIDHKKYNKIFGYRKK